MQPPVNGLQMSWVHVSPSLQSASTLHAAPQPLIFWYAQPPLALSQLSLVHGFLSSQTLATPVHRPLAQTSPLVQAFLSSQLTPLANPVTHVPFTQLSVVQA